MSMPTFQPACPPVTFEEAINMILTSIAMEELSLSNIINAEGEKLQYVLKTLRDGSGNKVSVNEILCVNKSIKNLLDSVMHNQILLKSKMESALNALEENRKHSPCRIGPTGPMGPTGPQGPSGVCSAVTFPGSAEQYWHEGKPLQWSQPGSTKCCSYLSSDGKKIILREDSCYSISFTLNLCVEKTECKNVSIGVQLSEFGKKTDKFIYHSPVAYTDAPFTVSAGGIFISTKGYYSCAELMLTLLSPGSVKVKQSSISVIEI